MEMRLRLFFCYAHSDEIYFQGLKGHLRILEHNKQIESTADTNILPGEIWKPAIDHSLGKAHIILLLVSPAFLASEACSEDEMKQALERRKQETVKVVPVIIRECDWKASLLRDLKALPKDGKAVSLWKNRDAAYQDVTEGIRLVVEEIGTEGLDWQTWSNRGDTYFHKPEYEKAIDCYNKALFLNPCHYWGYRNRGNAYFALKQYEMAISNYEKSIELGLAPPDGDAWAHHDWGNACYYLGRFEDARKQYLAVLALNPGTPLADQTRRDLDNLG